MWPSCDLGEVTVCLCLQPAPMGTTDRAACGRAAVAAALSVTTSPGSARVPRAGLATTASTVSQGTRDLPGTARGGASSVCSSFITVF